MTSVAGLAQSYDDAGNQTTGYSVDRSTSYVYKYDHHNRLSEIWDSTETNRKAAFTYDALGRRIVYVNDVLGATIRYYYDGVNEIAEFDASDTLLRRYVHGISYVDERLMMYDASTDRPYYYTLDRMYDVRMVVDRAGAIVERYMYDPYGRPYVTEMIGRGDMNNNVTFQSNDMARFLGAQNATIWDPRADLDDDGDVDQDDNDALLAKYIFWNQTPPTVRQAFSDVGNPYMFQGRPHFALDTTAAATEATLMLNDHRARFSDPVIGRWLTRDPLFYNSITEDRHTSPGRVLVGRSANAYPQVGAFPFFHGKVSLYTYEGNSPWNFRDPHGLSFCQDLVDFVWVCGSDPTIDILGGDFGVPPPTCVDDCAPGDFGDTKCRGGVPFSTICGNKIKSVRDLLDTIRHEMRHNFQCKMGWWPTWDTPAQGRHEVEAIWMSKSCEAPDGSDYTEGVSYNQCLIDACMSSLKAVEIIHSEAYRYCEGAANDPSEPWNSD